MYRKRSRFLLDKYFNIVGDFAICKLCKLKLRSSHSSNLKTHVIQKHKVKMDAPVIKQEKKDDAVSSQTNASKNKKKSETIKVEISQAQFFRSLICLVTEDCAPLSALNSNNLKNLFDPILRELSNTAEFSCLNSSNWLKMLNLVADHIRDGIKCELRQKFISLKIYDATNFAPDVYLIFAQFIKANKIETRMLAIVQLNSTPCDLAAEILNVLNEYDINPSHIVSITTDNGINLMKSLQHNPAYDEDSQDAEIYAKALQLYEASMEISCDNWQIINAATHLAQLCALEMTRDMEINNYLLNCRTLVKFIQTPTTNDYYEIFELKNLTMPELDRPIDFCGSTYNMLKALKDAKDVLENDLAIKKKSTHENCNDFWHFIEAYCIAFEPLQRIIVKFQQDQLHYGDFYAEWLICTLRTKKIHEKHSSSKYVEKIAKNLIAILESKMEKLLKNEHLISCLYFDPRFNHLLTALQKTEAATYLKKLYEKILKTNIKIESDKDATQSDSPSLESMEFADKEDEYLNEYLLQQFASKMQDNIDFWHKIEQLKLPFQRAACNVLHFWAEKEHSEPEMYRLSNICFAVPATQASIASTIASLELIFGDNYSQSNEDKTLENILLVKENSAHFEQAIKSLNLFQDANR